MANEIKVFLPDSGLTAYVLLFRENGDVYSESQGWGGLDPQYWEYYPILLSNVAIGVYFADMPVEAAGMYTYAAYEQLDVDPAVTDTFLGSGYISWDGTGETDFTSIAQGAAAAVATTIPSWDGTNSIQTILAALASKLVRFAEVESVVVTGAVADASGSGQVNNGAISQDSTPEINNNSGYNFEAGVFYITLSTPIPAGALINSAWLRVWCTAPPGGMEVGGKVELAADPQTFAENSVYTSRDFENASNATAEPDSDVYIDVATALQILIDQNPFESISHVVMVVYQYINDDPGFLSTFEPGHELSLSVDYDAWTVAMRGDIADSIMSADFASFATPSARSMLNALRFLRNKWAIVDDVLIVYAEDGTTVAWTAPLNISNGFVTGMSPS